MSVCGNMSRPQDFVSWICKFFFSIRTFENYLESNDQESIFVNFKFLLKKYSCFRHGLRCFQHLNWWNHFDKTLVLFLLGDEIKDNKTAKPFFMSSLRSVFHTTNMLIIYLCLHQRETKQVWSWRICITQLYVHLWSL